MPILAKVRRTGRCDFSTSRMISSLFGPRCLIRGRPQPLSRFFEQPVFKAEIGHQLLQCESLSAQVLHLASIRLAGCITGQPLLAGVEEFLRPAVIQALGDAFLAAKLGNAVLATKARQNNPDLLLRRMQLARRMPEILHDLLGGRLRRHGFLNHLQLQLGSR